MTLADRIAKDNVRAVVKFVDCTSDDDGWTHTAYSVTLKRKGHQMTVPFHMGIGHTDEPTALDVLSCVLSDVHGQETASDFPDWCEGYGFDSDSIKARVAYDAITRQAEQLRKFLRGGVRVKSAIREYLYETDWRL
jgi:hypothetical protein